MKETNNKYFISISTHNTVKRIKHCLVGMTDGTHGTHQRTKEGKLLLSAKNVFEDGLHISENESRISERDYLSITKNGYPHKEDILLCCVGTIGRCMIYNEEKPIAFQRSVIFMTCNKKILLPKMLFYCLQTKQVYDQERLAVNKSAQEGLYQKSVSEIYITFPNSINDQMKLINYLDKKCYEINSIIDSKRNEQNILQKYKKSIINEYVTGKKEVL